MVFISCIIVKQIYLPCYCKPLHLVMLCWKESVGLRGIRADSSLVYASMRQYENRVSVQPITSCIHMVASNNNTDYVSDQ